MTDHATELDILLRAARSFDQRGWLLATSGNLSCLKSRHPLQFYMSRSGGCKGELVAEDMLLLGLDKEVLEGHGRPSAETLVHQALYQKYEIGAIFHVHSVKAAVMSEVAAEAGALRVSNLEMIKGFDIWDEHAVVDIPIVENHADIPALAQAVAARSSAGTPGVLVRNHGIYAWGRTCAEARRHVEVIEYLCDYQYTMRTLSPG